MMVTTRALLGVLLLGARVEGLAKGGFGAPKKAKKKSAPATVTAEAPKYVALREWATAQGADVSGVVASECRPGLGTDLVATRAFKKGEIVARVPSELALALSDPGAEEADLADCGANFFKFGYLDNAFFKAYVETLPTPSEIASTPDAWTEEEVGAIEWPPLVEEAKARAARIAEVAEASGVEASLARYGACLASSRAQQLRLDADGTGSVDDVEVEVDASVVDAAKPTKVLRVLIPFLDTANWAANPNCRIAVLDAEKDDATFALAATKAVEAGEIVGVTYGAATTPELLLNYGFVPNSRLDGSNMADGRLVANNPDFSFAEETTTAERATLDDASANAPAKLASKLKITLKSARTNKKHQALFKATKALKAGVAAPIRPKPSVPPGAERRRVASNKGGGSGAASGVKSSGGSA